MKVLFTLIMSFVIVASLCAQDTMTFGPGNIQFLLEHYSSYSRSVVFCVDPIADRSVVSKFTAKRGEEAEAIAAFLARDFDIHLAKIDDGITGATLGRNQATIKSDYPVLPRIIVGADLHFSYSVETSAGHDIAKRTITWKLKQ